MIRKNIYSRITESIVNAYHANNLDTAMEDGHEMENMGKKIVAIITADPDQDLDWESEYEPFGASELTADDEQEAMEHDGIETADECEGDECDAEQDVCVSCGHPVMDDEDDDQEDIMIGGGFESEDETDEYEDMDVKDILVDILQELKGEDSEDEGEFETSDENPMFGGSEESDDEEDDYEDDEDDADSMLAPQDDWSSEESDDEDDDSEEEYDEEEDNEGIADENGLEQEDVEGMLASPEDEEDEVEIFDCLDNA